MRDTKRLKQQFIKTNLVSVEFNLLKDFVDRGLNREALKQMDSDIEKLEARIRALKHFKTVFTQFDVEIDCDI